MPWQVAHNTELANANHQTKATPPTTTTRKRMWAAGALITQNTKSGEHFEDMEKEVMTCDKNKGAETYLVEYPPF